MNRSLPHEELECCPNCLTDYDFNRQDGYTIQRARTEESDHEVIVGIYCDTCGVALHQYWFLSEFRSAYDSAYKEKLYEFDPDGYIYTTQDRNKAFREMIEELDEWFDEDGEVLPTTNIFKEYERLPICCDQPIEECMCTHTITFNLGLRYASKVFDHVSDLYSMIGAADAQSKGLPNCGQCMHYCEATCFPLRSRLYMIAQHGGIYQHDPIHPCEHFEPDMSYQKGEFHSF